MYLHTTRCSVTVEGSYQEVGSAGDSPCHIFYVSFIHLFYLRGIRTGILDLVISWETNVASLT